MLLTSLLLQLSTPVVYASDSDETDDTLEESDSDKGKKSSGKSRSARAESGTVREIARGFYAKSDVGGAMYLGRFAAVSPYGGGQYASSGTYVSLAVGQDFVDQEKMSVSWELDVDQGLHNGVSYEAQAADGCISYAPCLEGDLRTYTGKVMFEYSYYPSRRFGIGIRAGGGVLYSPLLMDATAYAEDVLPAYGVDPGLHNTIHPVFGGGPTIEYYTKLSHFSVGADVDVFYGIGWDLGLNAAGYLKYTF
jgi:hypothetical protein